MIYVNSITVSPDSVTVIKGNWYHGLSAIVCPNDADSKSVTWKSDNTDVATVNELYGSVYAKSAGTAKIYATAIDGSEVTGYCTVTVQDPILVEDITLNHTCIEMRKGTKCTLNTVVCPENATKKTVKWCSSNPWVATVHQSLGIITAKAGGVATIYAIAQDGSEVCACCRVTVLQTVVDPTEEEPENKTNENTFADPVDVYTGAHLLNNTLMSLFGGQRTAFTAHYDSTKLTCGELGSGWWHNFEKRVEVSGSEALIYSSPSVYSRYIATDDCCNIFACVSPDKNGYILTVNNAQQYPYVLNCNSAFTEYYDSCGKLAKIVDHQGFETAVSYSDTLITITDCVSGKKIFLEKDSTCKIVRVYDEISRQATLTYTGNLLTAICDVNGNTITYCYDEYGRIISGTDAKGICYFENTYDEYGRVKEQKDAIAGSLKSLFVYEDCKRITANRNGKQSIRCYDDNGLLICYTDENGNSKCYEYDERYNIVKETDAQGNAITKCYNSFNKPVCITDKNGNYTNFTYDNEGNVTKICHPAVGGVIPEETFVYNTRNQLVQHSDVRGTITVYTYDVNGMPATKKVGSKNPIIYSYVNGQLSSVTDAMGNVTTYVYNAIGQMVSQTNAENKTTSFTYDSVGNLLKTTDPYGKTIVNTFDCNHQKTSVTDANGNKTEYSYNGNMKNDVVTLPDGNKIRYEFDGEDRTVKIIDQANNVTNITYDNAGRIISKQFADGATVQYQYDAVGNVVKEINPKCAVTVKTYDKNGNVLTVTDNRGNTTSYQYNALNKVTKMINAVAGCTFYEYSPAGDLLSQTDALGNKITYTYDAYGNKLTVTDAKNNVTTYTYDANNNLLSVKDALDNVTTYTYNCLNQCVAVKDALNNIIRYGYDALGRKITITDAKNNVFTTNYDGNGNVISTVDAKGNTVSQTVYNSLNLPLTVTNAMGKTTSYTYNVLGKTESITDAMNHTSRYSYDSRGRNTSVVDAANGTSGVAFDLLGNIICLSGPLGGSTSYTYDDMGLLTAESTVSGGTVSYTYNELNIRQKITNARGQVRQFFHDSLGRVTGYTTPEGTVSYTYDVNGNVLTVTDHNGTITRTFDALNRVTSYTDTSGSVIRYEYDAVGNLTKIIYPDNTAVSYSYDANRKLVRVTDWAGRVTAYTYDENNRVIGVTKPDGSVTTTVYDNMQRVTSSVERTADGTVISGFEYVYDDNSGIIEEKNLANFTKLCYTYDDLNRVTSRTIKNISDNSVIATETYSYDAAGNVNSQDSAFLYDVNNRLIAINGQAVNYDADGNMLSNGCICCTYDSANRLISADGIDYTYTAEDVRIRALSATEDTSYVYDTNCKLSKLLCKTTNGTTTKYVYGRGLIGEESNSSFKTYHFDSRGSTVAITDASGNITDTFEYDTYGKLLSRTGTSQVIFGYNGRDGVITDVNGLIYMRARYYSPDMRRFINADIIPGEISNAVTLNRFAYANGNPVSLIDPFGLSADDKTSEVESINDLWKQFSTKNQKNISSKLFAKTLDLILSFKSVITLNITKNIFSFNIGPNTVVNYSTTASSGSGNVHNSITIDEQLELLGSLEFSMNNYSVSIDSDGALSVGCSYEVDEYTSIEASISGVLGYSFAVEYSVTTNDTYNNEVTTTLGIEFMNNKKPPQLPERVRVPEIIPVPNKEPAYGVVPTPESTRMPSMPKPVPVPVPVPSLVPAYENNYAYGQNMPDLDTSSILVAVVVAGVLVLCFGGGAGAFAVFAFA